MARGGGDDLTNIVILGGAAYLAYKAGLLCTILPGAPCPSGGGGGGGTCSPACGAGTVCQNGVCVPSGGGTPWNVYDITLYFLESVQPVSQGSAVDALVTLTYTGPGGNVAYGFQTGALSVGGCQQTYQNSVLFPLAAASSPATVSLYTSGLRWQGGCALCFGGGFALDVWPYVLAGGQTFTGPTYTGALTC